MTATGVGTDPVTAGDAGDRAAGRRRPWWVWAVPFALLFGLLCVRNRFLFTTRLYEQGDAGANSILIEQAKRFTLLVGNYSRERFHHPGPAYMYVQAFGDYVFRNALHLVPTAWNAHMLSVFALDSAFVAMAVAVVYGWTRSVRGAAACLAVFLGFAIAYPPIANSDWMPYMYVVPYMVFVLSAGSVAAGRASDLWILALSGWLLIHGHACFLLFVPVIAAAVLVTVLWRHRSSIKAGHWIPAAVISAVFAVPIAVNLALHWPGDFGKYISYGGSGRAGGHGPGQVAAYALWFWWPHRAAWLAGLVAVALYALALAVTRWLAPGPLRALLFALLGVNVLSTLAFLLYVSVGIDDLSAYYIGYFYWSAPLITVLVIVLGAAEALGQRRLGRGWLGRGARRARDLGTGAAVLAAAAALAVLAAIPATRTSTNDIDQSLPQVVATLAARAPGKTIVLHIADHPAWVETTGFLVQAERSGVRACLDQPWFTFLMTTQFICTPAQIADGQGYRLYTRQGLPRGTPVILRFSGLAVAAARS
jgi:hypothetical protein